MDEKSVKKFLLLSCVIAVLSAVLVHEFKYFTKFSFPKRKHFLIIGILSAPENFEQRLSIRKTWLRLLPDISASAYFIIGNELCEFPHYDRADPYSCIDKPFVLSENVTALTEFYTMKIKEKDSKRVTSVAGFIGFGFYVRSKITVNKLGVLKELLLILNKEIQVKLISAFDNKILASVTFNSELLSECTSSVLTKAIKPVTLNSYFEGFLKFETKDIAGTFLPECNFAVWENEPHVINFIYLWQEGSVMPQPFNEKSCTFIFMTYTVNDAESVKQHIKNRTLRLKEWNELNNKLSFKIKRENNMYNDIILVNVTDVYRNLSMKLTHFYKRILNTEYFLYVLKADDDSFIDVLRVYEHLKQVNSENNNEITKTSEEISDGKATMKPKELWWWSFFKEFWKVEHSGKWRENHYRSVSYPTFPCGGGYVLNKEIVHYIAESTHLHHFQGEDVSLGIWLSTLPVTQYKTPKVIKQNSSYELQKKIIIKFKGERFWENFKVNKTVDKMASNLCEWTCNNIKYFNIPLCNKVQLSTQNMYAVWKEYIKKGFL